MSETDPGAHYRYEYQVKITESDAARGYVTVKLDPFRIAEVCEVTDPALFTILKKSIRGGKAIKDLRQDMLDIQDAARRKLEMMDEDGE